MYLIKTEFVKLRRCNILWVGIITLLCAPLLSILQQQSLNDPVDNYGYVNLVNGTIWNNMSFFLPVTLMLLGGYMISREYTDDTLKEIFIIPLSYSKLMAGKIGALLILSVFYSFYTDYEKMESLFSVLSELCDDRKKDYISYLMTVNADPELFRRIPLCPTSYSWSGSAVPLYSKWADYLKGLLPLFSGIQFLQHQKVVNDEIEHLSKMIERAEIEDLLQG